MPLELGLLMVLLLPAILESCLTVRPPHQEMLGLPQSLESLDPEPLGLPQSLELLEQAGPPTRLEIHQ